MSNDPEQDYFSDGMAEEIINSLNHLKDLKVAGRTSSFQFKTKNIDLREIGEKLGVKTVVEGSIRKQGNRVRVTAQLVNVEDGFHLWSEKYDRNIDDILLCRMRLPCAFLAMITLFGLLFTLANPAALWKSFLMAGIFFYGWFGKRFFVYVIISKKKINKKKKK